MAASSNGSLRHADDEVTRVKKRNRVNKKGVSYLYDNSTLKDNSKSDSEAQNQACTDE